MEENDGGAPVTSDWSTRFKDWWHRELSRRAYLVVAALFAAFAGFSLYKLLSPGHHAFVALLGIVGNLLSCGLMVAGYLGRARRDRRGRSPQR